MTNQMMIIQFSLTPIQVIVPCHQYGLKLICQYRNLSHPLPTKGKKIIHNQLHHIVHYSQTTQYNSQFILKLYPVVIKVDWQPQHSSL